MARAPKSTAPPWGTSRWAASSAWGWRSRTAGRIRCRTARKSGSGHWTASPMDCVPGSRNSRARSTTGVGFRWWKNSTAGITAISATCARSARWRAGAWRIRHQTAQYYGGERAQQKVEDHTLGYYQALVEARIPFEMVHDQLLDADHTAGLQVLIFPNIAALSDRQCGEIREFVARGGGLVATYETSLYDERGERRRDFGLADLFGASFDGGIDERMQNSYLRLESDPRTGKRHPILEGLEGTERIINGVSRVHTRALGDSHAPLTLIPSYPDLPMEEVFPRVPKTDIPELHVRQAGRGRVVYFPWDIDRTFWEVLAADHGKLLRNAVVWAANELRPVTVIGPGVLDVTVWRQKDSMTVHLVNLTNPMMMKGPVREFIPTPPQKVAVRLPGGSRAKKVQLLVSGARPKVAETNGVAILTIAAIVDHEVIAIDL